MAKGIAIVGGGATMQYAPKAEDETWTVWTLGDFYDYIPRMLQRSIRVGAVFEMHPPSHYTDPTQFLPENTLGNVGHEARMADLKCKVYLAFPNPKIPNGMLYPLEEVLTYFGGPDYFCSSLAFMIPMAIMVIEESTRRDDGVFDRRLGMYGCDMQLTSEYAKERSCVEFWLGRAYDRGIEVVIPDESPLMKATYRYGYETETLSKAKALIKGRAEELQTMAAQWAAQEKIAHDNRIQYESMFNETGWASMNLTDVAPPPSQPIVAPPTKVNPFHP